MHGVCPTNYGFRLSFVAYLTVVHVHVEYQLQDGYSFYVTKANTSNLVNRILGIKINVLVSGAVDHGFELRSRQFKDYEIGICCFSAKNAALRKRSNEWLTCIQDNMSKWCDMSILGLLFR